MLGEKRKHWNNIPELSTSPSGGNRFILHLEYFE